jgi:uncharacterized protein (TIGR00251 family)
LIQLSLKVIPNASKDEVVGFVGESLKVRAHREKGKANKAIIQLLCKVLNIPKNSIVIVSGVTSSIKIIEIENVSKEPIGALLGAKD